MGEKGLRTTTLDYIQAAAQTEDGIQQRDVK